MFTVKLYSNGQFKTRIVECESLTVLAGAAIGSHEITLHQKDGNDCRYDIGEDDACTSEQAASKPPVFAKAIVENSAGKTTEIIQSFPHLGAVRQTRSPGQASRIGSIV